MAVKIKTKDGLIDISNGVIATVVGGAATSNYGVVGMACKNAIRDGFDGILNRANYKRGVVVSQKIMNLLLTYTLLLVMDLRFLK